MASKKKRIQSESNQIPLGLSYEEESRLEKAFNEFDANNPHIWKLFVRFALEAINAGWKSFGGRIIAERIRWECAVVTISRDEFKINDHHTPYCVRKFQREYPQYAHVFRTRTVVGDRERQVRID